MIFEITNNKYVKTKVGKTIDLYEDWFRSNPNVWIKSKDLEQILDRTSTRTYVNKLRCKGLPILSDTKLGYKLATDKDEIKKCYEKLRLRALIAYTASKLMKRFL